MAGVDVEVTRPVYVPLHLELSGCVAAGHLPADVEAPAARRPLRRVLPGGRPRLLPPRLRSPSASRCSSPTSSRQRWPSPASTGCRSPASPAPGPPRMILRPRSPPGPSWFRRARCCVATPTRTTPRRGRSTLALGRWIVSDVTQTRRGQTARLRRRVLRPCRGARRHAHVLGDATRPARAAWHRRAGDRRPGARIARHVGRGLRRRRVLHRAHRHGGLPAHGD